MSRKFYNSKGEIVEPSVMLGRGGEGSVYEISDKALVAKIYHHPTTSEKAEKLRWMSQNYDDKLLTTSAWVLDTLHSKPGGPTVGIIMPRISAKEIHELYSPKSRRIYFPSANWPFLIQTAKNLSVAFHNIHTSGHVIGDVNQGNVVVLSDGTVKLIDCDSYQVTIRNKLHRCEVGVTTHIPPELQGVPLDTVLREQNHDNFGLAVLIFQLLFLGRHPFAGNYIGAQDRSLDDSIREHRFAYGQGASQRRVKQPPGSLALEALNPDSIALFERAFLQIPNRPGASEWFASLNKLSATLAQCSTQVSHHYFKSLSKCPWCEIEKASHWPVFPTVTSSGKSQAFNITTIETLLNSFRYSGQQSALAPRASILPPPSAELLMNQSIVRRGLWLTMLFQAIGLTVAVVAAGPGRAFIGSVFVVIAAIVWASKSNRNLHKSAYETFSSKREQWSALEAAWTACGNKLPVLSQEAKKLSDAVAKYKELPAVRSRKIKELEMNAKKHQLENFLDQYRIDKANISGIGWRKLQVLQSFGIESAADVERSEILRIPGFGPTFTSKLVAWRQGLEGRFTFNATSGVPKQEVQRVEHELLNVRLNLEALLSSTFARVKAQSQVYEQTKAQITKGAAGLRTELAQAQSNANATTLVTLPMALLVAISFAIPLASLLQRSAAREYVEVIPSKDVSTSLPVENPSLGPPESPPSNTLSSVNANTDSVMISDSDISLMTQTDRSSRAKEFYENGLKLSRANDFIRAEKAFSEANRYTGDDAKILHELGYARYRLKRMGPAIEVLQKALKISPSEDAYETRKVLGLAFMGAQRWSDAKDIYSVLVESNPKVFEFQFQLGMAAKKNGDTLIAVSALEKATASKYTDAKAHYELADVYISLGRMSDAEAEAEILATLSPALAKAIRSRLDN